MAYDARHHGGPAGHCVVRHDPERPAEYRWTAPIGNVLDLCGECCAAWRANGERWPDLAPARITTINRHMGVVSG